MLYIGLSLIPTYNGTASRPGWTDIQQLYENIHPNHALVQLKLSAVKVYWRDRVGGLLGPSTVSNACSFEYVEALNLTFGDFPQIVTENNLVGHIIVQGTECSHGKRHFDRQVIFL